MSQRVCLPLLLRMRGLKQSCEGWKQAEAPEMFPHRLTATSSVTGFQRGCPRSESHSLLDSLIVK
jgi:hypothetical protein